MKFRFKRKESVEAAVCRLSRGSVKKALKSFRKENELEAIHSVRKEIKKLRSLPRLVRGEIGKRAYKRRAKSLRRAAAYLAEPRDAHVQVRALRELAVSSDSVRGLREFRELEKVLKQNVRRSRAEFEAGGCAKEVRRILRGEPGEFAKLKIRKGGWGLIGPAIKDSYNAGREACRAARRGPAPGIFHEWRKRVKDLWHYLQLLRPVSPEQMGAAADDLEKLGEYLGDDHDLHLLELTAAATLVGPRHREVLGKLRRLIKSRQSELRSKALTLGSRFYREAPSIFCENLHQYWRVWRSKPERFS